MHILTYFLCTMQSEICRNSARQNQMEMVYQYWYWHSWSTVNSGQRIHSRKSNDTGTVFKRPQLTISARTLHIKPSCFYESNQYPFEPRGSNQCSLNHLSTKVHHKRDTQSFGGFSPPEARNVTDTFKRDRPPNRTVLFVIFQENLKNGIQSLCFLLIYRLIP